MKLMEIKFFPFSKWERIYDLDSRLFSHVHISPFCLIFLQDFHCLVFLEILYTGALQLAAPWLFLASWPEFTALRADPGHRGLFFHFKKKCPFFHLSAADTMPCLLQGQTDESRFATRTPLGNDSSPTGEAARRKLDCIYKAAVGPAIKPLVSLQGLDVAPCDYLPRSRVRRCCKRCVQCSPVCPAP